MTARNALLAALLIGLIGVPAHSELLVYDPFQIGVGADKYLEGDEDTGTNLLGGQNPATGPTAFYAGPWIQVGGYYQAVKGVGGYSYPLFPSSGGRVHDFVQFSCCSGGRTGREIAGGLGGGLNPRTIFQSFLIDFGDQGTDDPTHFGMRAYEMWNGDVYDGFKVVDLGVNSFAGTNDFTLKVTTPTATASALLDGGGRTLANMAGTHLVVMKFEFDPVLPDAVSVFLDPTDSIESHWTPSAAVSVPNSDLHISHHGAMSNYTTSGAGHVPGGFDELRWGDTFADVTPFVHNPLTPFVDNPTSNSVDWSNHVQAAGGVVNSHVDFETHPAGPLQNDFYLASEGVTLSQVEWSAVETGSGGTTGSNAEPLSPGEGPLGTATYVTSGAEPYRMTVTFDEPVMGAGFMFADYFNAFDDNTNTIQAFSGPNGTGIALGQFQAAPFNFETNNLYFMGLADTANTIGSVVLSGPRLYGDSVYLDKILFARISDVVLPGDYNQNGTVDAADYVVWRKNVGLPAGALPNDADGGVIGTAQYDTWRARFGETTFSGSGVSATATVPEPSSLILLAVAASLLAMRRAQLLH